MRILDTLGFIKTRAKGGQTFGTVLLVHPSLAVAQIAKSRESRGIPAHWWEHWWDEYRRRQLETKETRVKDIETL